LNVYEIIAAIFNMHNKYLTRVIIQHMLLIINYLKIVVQLKNTS
jgi:hypothetical protein